MTPPVLPDALPERPTVHALLLARPDLADLCAVGVVVTAGLVMGV